MDKLDDSNFLLYAAKHYDNVNCLSIDEFNEDLARIKYIRKLLKKYQNTGELRHRLILNHIIILNNTFGNVPTCRMLFLKMRGMHHLIKPFLVLLNTMPEIVPAIGPQGINIRSSDIEMDQNIVNHLRNI